MAKIIFQGFNDNDNKLILKGFERRVMGSQKIWCEIDNEKGLIEFKVQPCEVPVEYQAKTIKMVMDDFVLNSREGILHRAYKDRDILKELIEAIKSNRTLEW